MSDCGCSGSAKSRLNVIGKTLSDAEKFLDSAGVKHRIVKKDGEPYIITMDLNTGRANLTVTNGVVVEQYWG